MKLPKKENAAAAEDAKIEEVAEEGLKAEEEKTEEAIDAKEAAAITTKTKVESLTVLIEVTDEVLTRPIEVPALEGAEVNHFQNTQKNPFVLSLHKGIFYKKKRRYALQSSKNSHKKVSLRDE